MALVLEWAALHRQELRADWERARGGTPLESLTPSTKPIAATGDRSGDTFRVADHPGVERLRSTLRRQRGSSSLYDEQMSSTGVKRPRGLGARQKLPGEAWQARMFAC
jgi:hypothetical protein